MPQEHSTEEEANQGQVIMVPLELEGLRLLKQECSRMERFGTILCDLDVRQVLEVSAGRKQNAISSYATEKTTRREEEQSRASLALAFPEIGSAWQRKRRRALLV